MVTFKRLKLAAFLVLLVLLAPATSVSQDLMVTISSDISLGTWTGVGDKESSVGVCVYNSGGSGYSITASGSGGGFSLTGTGGSIVYGVSFSDTGVSGTFAELTNGSSRSFSGADESSSNCGGSSNAGVRVTVSEAALGAAAPGNYSGTLTLVLTAS
ncbi:MAG: hypothetical protein RL417_1760 [Pseudomonadota bacterium]|jgi:hypothetical protein